MLTRIFVKKIIRNEDDITSDLKKSSDTYGDIFAQFIKQFPNDPSNSFSVQEIDRKTSYLN